MSELGRRFVEDALKRFENAKALGDGALGQLAEEDLFFALDAESNSIAVILQHLHGNMMSRWTDFLTADGEKPWRQRDAEFEPQELTAEALRGRWEEGWACLFTAIGALAPDDLLREVRIREQPMTAIDAILRQLGHVNYHVGQIVLLAKHLRGPGWKTLSIARGRSGSYKASRKD